MAVIRTESTLQLRAMVTGFPGACIVQRMTDTYVQYGMREQLVPPSINQLTRVERFDWLADTIDMLALAFEAERAE